jgi:cellulose synthase/poly-beta-1,6-N-acetylglucosamine synthase-like glycosyltransferase
MSNTYKKKGISIVVPVLNEAGNIAELLKRIDSSVKKTKLPYEVIMIDDHSIDNTQKEIEANSKKYPVKYFKKKGIIGKAQSLLEGFSEATYDILCMIDSDLQYPPEAIPEMLKKMDEGYGVVIANRKERQTNFLRKFTSKSFNFVFGKWLHSLDFDIQSGLKLFKSEIIERVELRPLPWSFDLEFLIAARSAGYRITSVDILFDSRKNGKSKVNVLWASMQIGLSALILKFDAEKIIPFHQEKRDRVGQGFHYKRTEFIHFSDLNERDSAIKTVFGHQAVIMSAILIVFIIGLIINWEKTITIFVAFITVVYFSDLLFNLFLILKSLIKSPEIEVENSEINKIKNWPMYTIFCPLYKEWLVVEQFVQSIEKLDYPKDKLQVQLLLEADDTETIDYVKKTIKLPDYFDVVVVHIPFQSKPKACNYGLRVATGEYAVIYDAEDIPDVLQLKKAVVAFRRSPEYIACIQAKLNYYNKSQNLLTRLFTAEYSLWFDLILTGLQSLNAPPLGGTSNHFKVERLREVKGWDSFNVTRIVTLGIRLAKTWV